MIKNVFLWLIALSQICFSEEIKDEFIIVQKRNVTHKFCLTDKKDQWVDTFLQRHFINWENDTFDIFEKVKDKNGIAIDIGSWIGTTAIWLSKEFSYVVAVEADKEAIHYLKKNLVASDCTNVAVCEKAISQNGEPCVFGPRTQVKDVLNYSTSCLKNSEEECGSTYNYKVSTITFNQIIDEYVTKNKDAKGTVSFIKCDIEGGEEGVLRDILEYAQAHKCSIWMSFHYDWWTHKNIETFKDLFAKFNSNYPSEDICEYIKKKPFSSILFTPK